MPRYIWVICYRFENSTCKSIRKTLRITFGEYTLHAQFSQVAEYSSTMTFDTYIEQTK